MVCSLIEHLINACSKSRIFSLVIASKVVIRMRRYVLLVLENGGEGTRIKAGLEEVGYQVGWCQSGDEAIHRLNDELPELVLLGTDLTEEKWERVLERIGRFAPFPIILLLHEWNSEIVVQAFASGVNDCVNVTVPMAELYARMGHLLSLYKQIGDGAATELGYGPLRMELRNRKVYRDGEEIMLTSKEFDLLLFLARRAGKVCSREMILQQVWGYEFATGTNVVDVYIRHLRQKLDRGRMPKLLHTIRGTGYMLR